jgi:hypothetical protein
MYLFSAVSHSNTDPVSGRDGVRRGKTGKHRLHSFFCGYLNSGAYIVSKEVHQVREINLSNDQ